MMPLGAGALMHQLQQCWTPRNNGPLLKSTFGGRRFGGESQLCQQEAQELSASFSPADHFHFHSLFTHSILCKHAYVTGRECAQTHCCRSLMCHHSDAKEQLVGVCEMPVVSDVFGTENKVVVHICAVPKH